MDPQESRHVRMICLFLGLVTFILYAPILGHEFISYDDLEYVRGNVHVQDGLTAAGLDWAVSAAYSGNWHPLTWISHMLDCQIYGLNHPGGHHFTSLLFHIANALLLFLLLKRMTGAVWRSGLVAALFAWHPLHVESVAWIAERKDVLSTFFGLLTFWAYSDYVKSASGQNPKTKIAYGAALLFFGMGLMSKPMVVTLPFVLLLLDVWPLRRISELGKPETSSSPLPLARLILEKLPFFALALVSSVVTFVVQRKGGAVASLGIVPFEQRLPNVLVSYIRYLGKMLWPADLAIFYPLQNWATWQWVGAGALVLAISALAVLTLRTRPYLFVGWFWYLGMLVPVIGLVQVGAQSLADRYTYLPLVGVFIAVVWGVTELASGREQVRAMANAAGGLALAGCVVLTMTQVRYWKNTETLFTHALAVTGPNPVALDNMGLALEGMGKLEDAVARYKVALEMEPRSAVTLHLMGLNFAHRGDYKSAVDYYTEALHYGPDLATVHYHLGNALTAQGKLEEAAAQYAQALNLEPGSPDVHNNLGAVLVRLGRLDEAVAQFQSALQLKANFPEAQVQLGGVMVKKQRLDLARIHYAEAVRLKPDFAAAQFKLALVMAQQGDVPLSIPHFQAGLAYDPKNADGYFNLGAAYAALGDWPQAVGAFEKAAGLKPGDAASQKRLAEAKAKMVKASEDTAASDKQPKNP